MSYRSISISEFFKRNRQITGFTNPSRSVYQTIRELVENSLDATETYGILPDIKMDISVVDIKKSFIKIIIEDNGIGIPQSKVPEVFGRFLFGSKYDERQTRGIFGLGVKAVVLYSQMTTNIPLEVYTKTKSDTKKYYFKIQINVKKNEPIVLEKKVLNASVNEHGTKISIVIMGDWNRAKNKVLEYFKRTHILCPYTSFLIKYPDGMLKLERKSNILPTPPNKIPPHPHGIDIETFKHLMDEKKQDNSIYSLLIKLSGVGHTSAKDFLKKVGIFPKKKIKKLKNEEIVKIVHEMSKYPWRPPPSSALSPVGKENIIAGLSDLNPEFSVAITRPSRVYRGHPFLVEVGVGYGGDIEISDKPTILRYANKIPLLYDDGVDVTTKVISNIDWKRYGIYFPAPLVVVIHVAGTKLPFYGLGKEAISNEQEIENEIRLAILEAGRKLQKFLAKKRKEYAELERKITFLKYKETIATSISKILDVDKNKIESKYEELILNNIK